VLQQLCLLSSLPWLQAGALSEVLRSDGAAAVDPREFQQLLAEVKALRDSLAKVHGRFDQMITACHCLVSAKQFAR